MGKAGGIAIGSIFLLIGVAILYFTLRERKPLFTLGGN